MGEWVTASEVGEEAFCPEARRLRARGARPSKAAQARMDRGVTAHEAWTRAGEQGRRSLLGNLLFAAVVLFIGVLLYLMLFT